MTSISTERMEAFEAKKEKAGRAHSAGFVDPRKVKMFLLFFFYFFFFYFYFFFDKFKNC